MVKVATLKRPRQDDEHRPASESTRPEQEHEMLSQAETLRFGGSVRNLSLELAAAAPEALPAEASGEAPPAEATEASPAVEEPDEEAEAPPVPPAEIPWGEPREAVPVEAVPPGEEPAEDGGDGHAQEAQEITCSGWVLKIRFRKSGKQVGHRVLSFVDPDGTKYASKIKALEGGLPEDLFEDIV